MCVVSNIGDHHRWPDQWPWQPVEPTVPVDPVIPDPFRKIWEEHAKDAEIDDLKKRVSSLEELLRKGKQYDDENGEPECEMDEKVELLKKLAKELGVELEFPTIAVQE